MLRHAWMVLVASAGFCGEKTADLLESNPQPPQPPPVVNKEKKPLGIVDEPGFKATAKFQNAPEPSYDPLPGKPGTITPPVKHNVWSVPLEDGAQAPAVQVEPAPAPGTKTGTTAETISPTLAGAIAREKGGAKLDEMLSLYRAISTSEPDSAAAHYRYGLILLKTKEVQKGLVEIEASIRIEPTNTKYLCDYAIAALQAGWVEKAYAACNAAVSLAPTNARYLSVMAEIHLAGGHVPEAAEMYTRAIRVDPNNANLYYNMGLVHMNARGYKRAIEFFSEALKLKPNTSAFLCSRGLAWENLKNFKLAVTDYQAAMKADGKNPYAHYLYAGIFSDTEDPTYTNRFEAIEHAEKAVKLTNYKNAQYLMGLARALRAGRNYEQAADIAKRAVELEPGRVDLRQEWQKYEKLKREGVE